MSLHRSLLLFIAFLSNLNASDYSGLVSLFWITSSVLAALLSFAISLYISKAILARVTAFLLMLLPMTWPICQFPSHK